MRRATHAFLMALASVFSGCAITTPSSSNVLTARAYIEADVAEIWTHLTEPEAITAWFSAPCREFGSQPGDAAVWADTGRPERARSARSSEIQRCAQGAMRQNGAENRRCSRSLAKNPG